jgi:hypothetical protein
MRPSLRTRLFFFELRTGNFSSSALETMPCGSITTQFTGFECPFITASDAYVSTLTIWTALYSAKAETRAAHTEVSVSSHREPARPNQYHAQPLQVATTAMRTKQHVVVIADDKPIGANRHHPAFLPVQGMTMQHSARGTD